MNLEQMQARLDFVNRLGRSYQRVGNYNEAIVRYRDAIEISKSIGDGRGEATALRNIGTAYAAMGEYRKTWEWLEASRRLFAKLNFQPEARDIEQLTTLFLGQRDAFCLHRFLKSNKAQGVKGPINLFERISEIKEQARDWLNELGGHGLEHSQRLEEYLDALTAHPLRKGKLTAGEVFVLLCAVYLHEIGFMDEGQLMPVGRFTRSYDRILTAPGKYLLGDFPAKIGYTPLAAQAVAWVCNGCSDEKFFPLQEVHNTFADHNLSEDSLNLRKLAALLRVAEEIDDPYSRLASSRSQVRAAEIGEETITWHWKRAGQDEIEAARRMATEKQIILASPLDYLKHIGFGHWHFALSPQIDSAVFMPEPPVETFVGREECLVKLHDMIQERKEGTITGIVGTGGIGKTELAKMYAQRFRSYYPGGIFWASMKGSNWKVEAPKILAELHPGTEPMVFAEENKAKDEVKRVLTRKDALLVIDGVEGPGHIIKPGCHVLVTTRHKDAFGIMPRKAIQELPGLTKDMGLKLLELIVGVERVKQDTAAAERIVVIMGGMPLALEIAAAHLADAPDLSFIDYIGLVQFKVGELRLENALGKDVVASLELSLEQLSKAQDGTRLTALFQAASVCAASGFSSRTLGAAAGLGRMRRP